MEKAAHGQVARSTGNAVATAHAFPREGPIFEGADAQCGRDGRLDGRPLQPAGSGGA
jgi:hypothetical protein